MQKTATILMFLYTPILGLAQEYKISQWPAEERQNNIRSGETVLNNEKQLLYLQPRIICNDSGSTTTRYLSMTFPSTTSHVLKVTDERYRIKRYYQLELFDSAQNPLGKFKVRRPYVVIKEIPEGHWPIIYTIDISDIPIALLPHTASWNLVEYRGPL